MLAIVLGFFISAGVILVFYSFKMSGKTENKETTISDLKEQNVSLHTQLEKFRLEKTRLTKTLEDTDMKLQEALHNLQNQDELGNIELIKAENLSLKETIIVKEKEIRELKLRFLQAKDNIIPQPSFNIPNQPEPIDLDDNSEEVEENKNGIKDTLSLKDTAFNSTDDNQPSGDETLEEDSNDKDSDRENVVEEKDIKKTPKDKKTQTD